jgi:hypothetical protein
MKKSPQARYFKNMLRDADHLDKVGRLRVSEGDIEKLAPGYEVRIILYPKVFRVTNSVKGGIKAIKRCIHSFLVITYWENVTRPSPVGHERISINLSPKGL